MSKYAPISHKCKNHSRIPPYLSRMRENRWRCDCLWYRQNIPPSWLDGEGLNQNYYPVDTMVPRGLVRVAHRGVGLPVLMPDQIWYVLQRTRGTVNRRRRIQRLPQPLNHLSINVCSKSRIVSLKEWKSKCSARFGVLFSTRRGPFRLLRLPPCPPASTAPGEGLHGGLLEDSCGRRLRRVMPIRLNVGTYAPASGYETLI